MLDRRLPDIDGLDLLDSIKADERLSRFPEQELEANVQSRMRELVPARDAAEVASDRKAEQPVQSARNLRRRCARSWASWANSWRSRSPWPAQQSRHPGRVVAVDPVRRPLDAPSAGQGEPRPSP